MQATGLLLLLSTCRMVKSMGMPSFQTDWFIMEAQNESYSPLLINHNLPSVPLKVDVLMKDEVSGVVFSASPGGAMWDDDLKGSTYCGISYAYDDHVVRLHAPYSTNEYTFTGIICHGGNTWSATDEIVRVRALVKVLVWSEPEIPSPDFMTKWIAMSSSGLGYAEVEHNLGRDHVLLLVQVRGYSDEDNTGPWYAQAIGSSQDPYDVKHRAAVVYGFNATLVRIWRGLIDTSRVPEPKGPPCLICMTDGWTDFYKNGISVSEGEIRVLAWHQLEIKFQETKLIDTNVDSSMLQVPLGSLTEDEIDRLTFTVTTEVLDGSNEGFVFTALGAAPILLVDEAPDREYGGVVYGFSSGHVNIWLPSGQNGHVIILRNPWGLGWNRQTSKVGRVRIVAWSWEQPTSRECHFKLWRGKGGPVHLIPCAKECCDVGLGGCVGVSASVGRCQFFKALDDAPFNVSVYTRT
ncbi:hypothetical protein CAPTEDRAFT_189165 [Capitella teleta]|uniref:Uncharacterized protein n=1 Tax=Capitella teleta TaxID=283909 RepID=R7UXW4_CAPTE|nr:hypothetical protein CAPTEDRAFT_189165 [Capitella teleta]|eukprot:ELU08261.1 hypothetical protein CAPTEDRAFT_189165 [Capitella teleta]